MRRATARRTSKLSCPSCGASIHFVCDKNRTGICPECGEWLRQRNWPNQGLERMEEEIAGSDFDESDAWERALMEEIE